MHNQKPFLMNAVYLKAQRAITICNIYDLHNATNYSGIQHFTDDTNLLYSSKSLKDINKKINT